MATFNENQLFTPDGQVTNELEQELILTSDSDTDTAIKALAKIADLEDELTRAHMDLLTEAEQHLNILFLHKMLPGEIAKLRMPMLIRNQVVRMTMATPTTDCVDG